MIEIEPDERYGLSGISLQIYDSLGLVIHPLHAFLNALGRLESRLRERPHDPDTDSLFFRFRDNEGLSIMIWPRFYDRGWTARP